MARHIDIDAQNPLYEGAMILRDAQEGASFVTWDDRQKVLSFTALTSHWTEKTPDLLPPGMMNSRIIACGVEAPRHASSPRYSRDTIFLDHKGICPYEDGLWSEFEFSVLATEDNLRKLDAWLKVRYGYGIGHALWVVAVLAKGDNYPARFGRQIAELVGPYLDDLSLVR